MKQWMVAGLCAGLLVCSAGAAEVESLVADGYWAFWVKPEAKWKEIGSDSAGLLGGQVGISMNRSLYVGFGYYDLANAVEFGNPESGRLGSSELSYMGFNVGYTIQPAKVLHGALDLFVGWGESSPRLASGTTESSDLFLLEPGISLLANITKDVEFGLGLGYQIVNGSDTAGLSDSDLGGLTGSLFLRWTEGR